MRCDVQASANTQWLIPVTLCSRSGSLESETHKRQSHIFLFWVWFPWRETKIAVKNVSIVLVAASSLPYWCYSFKARPGRRQESTEQRVSSAFCLYILEGDKVWLLDPRPIAVYFSGPLPHLAPHQVSPSCPRIFLCFFSMLIISFHLSVL